MIPVIGTVLSGTMVNYMMWFFMSIGALALVVKGANVVWDGISTTWSALRADVKEAKKHDVSLLRLWKERIRASRPTTERIA